jgi:hypothetical protein
MANEGELYWTGFLQGLLSERGIETETVYVGVEADPPVIGPTNQFTFGPAKGWRGHYKVTITQVPTPEPPKHEHEWGDWFVDPYGDGFSRRECPCGEVQYD